MSKTPDDEQRTGAGGEPAATPESADKSAEQSAAPRLGRRLPPPPQFLVRHGVAVIIAVLATSLVAVGAVAVALWVQNSRIVEDASPPRPTVRIGVPMANPRIDASHKTTATTTRSDSQTSSAATTTPTTTATTTEASATTSAEAPTDTSLPPSTTSAPRPATAEEERELTGVLHAFYAALGTKDLVVLNTLSCVKITEEDLADQPDDLHYTVDEVREPTVDGDTASLLVTVTAASGGKSKTETGPAGFARISKRWVVCANQ